MYKQEKIIIDRGPGYDGTYSNFHPLQGTHWQKIDIPAKVPPTFQFMHVSVGMGAVWALGNNGKVCLYSNSYLSSHKIGRYIFS